MSIRPHFFRRSGMGVYKTVLFLKAQIRKKEFSRLGCFLGHQIQVKLKLG